MNILVLLTDLYEAVGGIQTFNRCLAQALSEASSEKRFNITVHALNDNDKNIINNENQINGINYRGFNKNKLSFALASLNASLSADIVIFGLINFSPLAILMRKHNLKKYLVVYGYEVWERLPFVKLAGVHNMTNILSISDYTKQEMAKHNNLNEEKFIIFPCTLDPFYAKDMKLLSRAELSLPEGNLLLTVSRLESTDIYKNIDLVIKSMPSIIKKIPDFYFVIVGEGSDRKRLEKLAFDLGVSGNIIFTGRVSDDLLPSYYNLCDVFVLPSLQEGFGIVFLEAMYFSKPCIGARAGAVSEVVEHNKTGLICEPSDVESLADSIICLFENKPMANKLGQAAKEKLNREFSFHSFKQRLENLL
ncbi:MAG: hypothetical protein A3B68_07955 [Candidatus Melainabacteria bacterium RIFCSPHIGHO2_02_FULL_34_12]|nr:MAG: hypothetical protein A3B68_07955 [Candidatus Melainabacteria bacterium RIFCSPHIGHO2_02_FULL_34_12]